MTSDLLLFVREADGALQWAMESLKTSRCRSTPPLANRYSPVVQYCFMQPVRMGRINPECGVVHIIDGSFMARSFASLRFLEGEIISRPLSQIERHGVVISGQLVVSSTSRPQPFLPWSV